MKKLYFAAAALLALSVVMPVFAFDRPAARPRPTPAARQTKDGSSASSKTLPSITPAQQANIQKLAGDLQTIKGKSTVTPEMKQQLSNDIMGMCKGATKPSQSSVDKLTTDLTSALSDKQLSKQEMVKLSKDLNYVLNSANISDEQIQQIVTDAETILKSSGISKSDAETIKNDLLAISGEIKKNYGK
ncbi:MAG: hypothetical protein LWY06_18050 [Firmicutes bacterium]|nr:hypothetical protein [Bacillota bacterium]